jgi:tellurite resistance protein
MGLNSISRNRCIIRFTSNYARDAIGGSDNVISACRRAANRIWDRRSEPGFPQQASITAPTPHASKGLPVVGKFLLQRNIIKIGIPLVGVPLAVVLNRYTTLLAGRHAQAVFRSEARVIELAQNLSKQSQHPELMLWVAWLVIMADGKIADEEALLIRHLVRLVRDQHQVVDEQLAHLVDVDPTEVWRRMDAEPGDLSDILDMAERVAAVDGDVNKLEKAISSELRARVSRV